MVSCECIYYIAYHNLAKREPHDSFPIDNLYWLQISVTVQSLRWFLFRTSKKMTRHCLSIVPPQACIATYTNKCTVCVHVCLCVQVDFILLQGNAKHWTKTAFPNEKRDAQVGFEPTTYCLQDRHSTNWVIEAAQLAGSNHGNTRALHLILNNHMYDVCVCVCVCVCVRINRKTYFRMKIFS